MGDLGREQKENVPRNLAPPRMAKKGVDAGVISSPSHVEASEAPLAKSKQGRRKRGNAKKKAKDD